MSEPFQNEKGLYEVSFLMGNNKGKILVVAENENQAKEKARMYLERFILLEGVKKVV